MRTGWRHYARPLSERVRLRNCWLFSTLLTLRAQCESSVINAILREHEREPFLLSGWFYFKLNSFLKAKGNTSLSPFCLSAVHFLFCSISEQQEKNKHTNSCKFWLVIGFGIRMSGFQPWHDTHWFHSTTLRIPSLWVICIFHRTNSRGHHSRNTRIWLLWSCGMPESSPRVVRMNLMSHSWIACESLFESESQKWLATSKPEWLWLFG